MAIRNIQIDIDDGSFQTALNRAAGEGKSLAQVVADFLSQYAVEGRGSTRGLGPAPAAPLTDGTMTTYTVQRGDSLARIAQKVYNDAHKYPLIQSVNKIADPSRIWVGQVLIIPAPVAAPTTLSPAPVGPAPLPPATPAPPPPSTPPPPLPPLPVPAPTTTTAPPKPAVRWAGSPNFNQRRSPNDITAITIHSTANSSLEGVIRWFNNPSAQVSAHYTIGKDGAIAQHVADQDRAWHAGRSIWKGRESCNDYCLGIELVNLNDGADPYPEAQHQANVALCAYLCHTYNIRPDDIMGHFEIALPIGRKSDPRNYDLSRLRREVEAKLSGR